MRAGKEARKRPRVLSGGAYLYGYARAAARRVPRVEIEGYGRFVRSEQRRRMLAKLPRLLPGAPLVAREGRKKDYAPSVRP